MSTLGSGVFKMPSLTGVGSGQPCELGSSTPRRTQVHSPVSFKVFGTHSVGSKLSSVVG